MKSYFNLFASCIPVKGASDSVIMDLQRESWITIPNILFEVLEMTHLSINELKKTYKGKYDEGIDHYFNFLSDHELGFFTDTPELFPKLNGKYLSPYLVLSSVINLNPNSTYNLKDVLSQLISLGTQTFQIRIHKGYELNYLFDCLLLFKESRTRIIELFIPYSQELKKVIESRPIKDLRIFIYVFLKDKTPKLKLSRDQKRNLSWVNKSLKAYPSEIISKDVFTVNTKSYLEATNFNIGLYRKVTIDYNGEIKNYPDHQILYGNVKQDAIADIIETEEFKRKGIITNDEIEKCKDCQFRYMCLSNSDLNISDHIIYKTISCSYDPYKDHWHN